MDVLLSAPPCWKGAGRRDAAVTVLFLQITPRKGHYEQVSPRGKFRTTIIVFCQRLVPARDELNIYIDSSPTGRVYIRSQISLGSLLLIMSGEMENRRVSQLVVFGRFLSILFSISLTVYSQVAGSSCIIKFCTTLLTCLIS